VLWVFHQSFVVDKDDVTATEPDGVEQIGADELVDAFMVTIVVNFGDGLFLRVNQKCFNLLSP